MEEGQVHRKALRVSLGHIGIAVKPYGLAAHEGSEEEECLEAYVVKICDEMILRSCRLRLGN